MKACKLPPAVSETVDGWLSTLPGCNPVTPGSAPAQPTKFSASLGAAMKNYVDFNSNRRWWYAGCVSDQIAHRTLGAEHTSAAEMTVEKCIDFCSVSGSRSQTKHAYAGLENGDECYCRNWHFDPDRAPQPNVYSNCIAKCVGNESEMCGGPGAL